MTAPSSRSLQLPVRPPPQHLQLKGLQPKTLEAHNRAIRRIGVHFNYRLDNLSEGRLPDYFTDLLQTLSVFAKLPSIR